MPNKANPDHYHALTRVVTLAEAARMVDRHPNSLTYAINAGNIAALRCGRVWLVSVDSLRDYCRKDHKFVA